MSKAPHRKEWFEAAQIGNDAAIAKLLTEWPELAASEKGGSTALHYAAQGGHDKVVAQLLAASCPSLIEKVAANSHMSALHFAAEGGHDRVVAQLLAAASPSLIASTDRWGRTALAHAALNNHEKVFSQLLAARPQLLDEDARVLTCAAQHGHTNIVERIVALRPNKLWPALSYTTTYGHEKLAERLLAIKPEYVFTVSAGNSTLLLNAVRMGSREFVEKLWRMNPSALHVRHAYDGTPFRLALAMSRQDLVELFQWSCSLDEIVAAFTQEGLRFEERYRPIIEEQCGCLLKSLNRDVQGLVFEYLGFTTLTNKPTSDPSNP